MSQYKIERWDVILTDTTIKTPMIYIKPDLTFVNFARANNWAVICEIEGTGTVYDGKKIPGVVDKSAYVPNCRPNFYDKTGYYVITLWADWFGYPEGDKLGNVVFSGLKAMPENFEMNDNSSTQSSTKFDIKKEYKKFKKQLNKKELIGLGMILGGFILLIIAAASYRK